MLPSRRLHSLPDQTESQARGSYDYISAVSGLFVVTASSTGVLAWGGRNRGLYEAPEVEFKV